MYFNILFFGTNRQILFQSIYDSSKTVCICYRLVEPTSLKIFLSPIYKLCKLCILTLYHYYVLQLQEKHIVFQIICRPTVKIILFQPIKVQKTEFIFNYYLKRSTVNGCLRSSVVGCTIQWFNQNLTWYNSEYIVLSKAKSKGLTRA